MQASARRSVTLLATVLVGLVATAVVSTTLRAQALADAEGRFLLSAQVAADLVVDEVGRGVSIAESARALLRGTETLTAEEFAAFVSALDLDDRYPSANAIALTGSVPVDEVDAYAAEVRGLGQEPFVPGPDPPSGDERWLITLIEPMDRNAAAVGFDIRTNPDARLAAAEARVTGTPRLTPPTTLVQEEADQSGVVAYMPFDGEEAPLEAGFTSIVFRGDDLLAGISGLDSRLGLRVRDAAGGGPTGDGLVGEVDVVDDPQRSAVIERSVLGRTWQIEVFAVDGYGTEILPAAGASVTGVLLTLAAALLLLSLQRAEERARTLADEVTEDLNRANHRLASVNAALAETVAALERSNVDLARSNDDLASFAHVASHDLKEPLRMVSGFSGLLRREMEGGSEDGLTEREALYLDFIDKGAARMQVLISDLLELADATNSGVTRSQVDIADVLDGVLEDLGPRIAEVGARIDRERLDGVVMDPRQTRGLLQNLVSNALKFARTDRSPVVVVDARAEDGRWTLQVVDNGIGIPADDREAVFEAFRRRHSREEYDGTGIGLAICASIAHAHEGDIRIEDGLDGGIRVVVELPQPREDEPRDEGRDDARRTVGAAEPDPVPHADRVR